MSTIFFNFFLLIVILDNEILGIKVPVVWGTKLEFFLENVIVGNLELYAGHNKTDKTAVIHAGTQAKFTRKFPIYCHKEE